MKTVKFIYAIVSAIFSLLMMFSSNVAGQTIPGSADSYTGNRANLGLFGARPISDLTICHSNNRLFAAVESPVSLFCSDDDAATWYRAFPIDSLEFNDDQQGWGGGGVKVFANNIGWVAAQTSEQGGTLAAAVISFAEGDTGTWKTGMDAYTLHKLIGDGRNLHSMALSDYWMFSSVNNYITRVRESAPINVTTDIFDMETYIGPFGEDDRIISMAISNTATGFPMVFVLDTDFNNIGELYYFDGSTATLLGTPHHSDSVMSVYLHPTSTVADTILINVKAGSHLINHYLSKDGGSTWSDITFIETGYISDFDHSTAWGLPVSNNAIILMPGIGVSEDFGATWDSIHNQTYNDAMAISPADKTIVYANSLEGLGIEISSSGASGPYVLQNNVNLSAVRVNKIDRTVTKSIFYIATGSGLAYTTEYNNPGIPNYAKWQPPFGHFPVADAGMGFGLTAVDIEQYDSMHVVAGFQGGFSSTTTGVLGFTNVTPTGWHTNPSLTVRDILILNPQVVIAAIGGENSEAKNQGDIWRSSDGGISWTKVTPAGFNTGNTIAMGISGPDTILYIGTGLAVTTLENEGILWGSTDLGLTWSIINYGPTGYNPDGTTIDHVPIYDIAVDPRGKDTLYIAAGCNLHYAFVRSTDGGLTYTTITDATGEGAFSATAINQNHPDSVFMAIRRDILTYDAISDNSTMIFRGFPGELIPDLEYGSLFMGTSTGFYQLTQYADPPISVRETPKDDEIAMDVYPNPTSGWITVEFITSTAAMVNLEVIDLFGKRVFHVSENISKPGSHSMLIDGTSLHPGSYLIRYTDPDKVMVKMVVKY